MLKKICNKCGRMIEQGKQCECQKSRHKQYNQTRRNQPANKFYHSISWERVRQAVESRANGLDEYALMYEKRITAGSIAHHIIEIEERPDLKLRMENIIYVSRETHNRIHAAYKRGGKEKLEMQQRQMKIRGA